MRIKSWYLGNCDTGNVQLRRRSRARALRHAFLSYYKTAANLQAGTKCYSRDPISSKQGTSRSRELQMAKKTSVRLMVPFSMHCTSCSHFIYKSTKFNARKSSTGDQYLGIAIVQFSIRCPSCGGEIVFRTDPKTSGYVVLSGADRNLDPWHDKAAEAEPVEARLARLAKQANEGHDRDRALSDKDHEDEPQANESQELTARQQSGGGGGAVALRLETASPHAPTPKIGTSAGTPAPGITKLPMPKRRKHLARH